jgi:hypothetical protein
MPGAYAWHEGSELAQYNALQHRADVLIGAHRAIGQLPSSILVEISALGCR